MRALLIRDIKLGIRAGGGAVIGILFYLAIVAVTPFAMGPDLNLLARIGPAVLWTGALLASLLGLERLFQIDREDGSLDLMVINQHELVLPSAVFSKCLAHWITTGLPLVLITPFLGLLLNMSVDAMFATAMTLLIGTPAITFIGAVGAAVAVSLPRGGLLVSVLILPLVIPVLIFGVMASYGAVVEGAPFRAPLLLLTALMLFFAVLGPLAAGYALRNSGD